MPLITNYQAASDLYAPLSGEVIERNEKVHENPQLVNKVCCLKDYVKA
jgi:glycine cleavage system H lipoate-binding protein